MASTGSGTTDDDTWLAALVEGAAHLPESRELDRMVGAWEAHTAWEPLPGRGVRRSVADCTISWILDGRVLEARTVGEDGVEAAKVLMAYDPAAGTYACFAVSRYSNSFQLERGSGRDEPPGLVFDGEERAVKSGTVIRYQRSITFDGPDRFTVAIDYPDVPPGTYGPMTVVYLRTPTG